jgi:hypothetical protein
MRIDGRSNAHARGDAVNAFQNDPNCRVALLSIRAAGVSPSCLYAWLMPVTHGWDRTLLLALCEALKRCRSGPTKSQRECYARVWRHRLATRAWELQAWMRLCDEKRRLSCT